MVKAALLLFLLIPHLAWAETIKFFWDKPLANSDGTPLQLTGYRFYISAARGAYGPAVATVSATSTTYSFFVPANLAGKTLYAVVSAYNSVGESEPSNEVVFTPAPKPGAVVNLKIGP